MKIFRLLYLTTAILYGFTVQAQTKDAVQNKDAAQLISDAREQLDLGDAETSLPMLNEAYEKVMFASPRNKGLLAQINDLQAKAYSMKYEWAKAIKLGLMANRWLGANRTSPLYPQVCYDLALFYSGRGTGTDYVSAIDYIKKSMALYNRESVEYFRCYNYLIYFYILNNNIEEANAGMENAIRSGRKCFGDNRETYVKELWKFVTMISELDNNYLAIPYANACLQIMEEGNLTNTREYIRRCVKLAEFNYQIRNFTNEITALSKIIKASKEMDGATSTKYVDYLRKLALAYEHRSSELRGRRRHHEEYDSCVQKNRYYEKLSRDILIQTGNYSEIRSYQVPLISTEARDLALQKKYAEAIHLEKIAYQLYCEQKDTMSIARSTSNLATYFSGNNNQTDSALYYNRIATDIYDRIPYNLRMKGYSYHNMSMLIYDKGNTKDALTYEEKAIKAFVLSGDSVSDDYAHALGNASVFCAEIGDNKQAMYYSNLETKVLQAPKKSKKRNIFSLFSRKSGKRNNQNNRVDNGTVDTYWNRTVIALNADSVPLAEVHNAYSKATSIQRDVFLKTFPSMTVEARKSMWEKRQSIFDRNVAEYLALSYDTDDSLVADAYNAMLIRDGMPRFIEKCDSSAIMMDWKSQIAAIDSTVAIVRFFLTETSNMGNSYSAFVSYKGCTKLQVIPQLFTDEDLHQVTFRDHGGLLDMIKSDGGRQIVSSEGRFGRMVWRLILSNFHPGITQIKCIGKEIGVFKDIDITKLSLEMNEAPINSKYTFKD